jgi:hypothetical protein
MPGMVLMGMEHILHLLLTIWFAVAAADALAAPTGAQRQTLWLCVLAALLATSRYEGFFLVGLSCVAFAARGAFARGLAIGAAAALPSIAYGLVSLANGALFLPNSLMLKAGGASASPLAVLLKPVGADDVAFYRNNPTLLLLVALGVIFGLVQVFRNRRVWSARVLLPLALSLTILLHGHFVFASTFWAYRYDAYLLGFGVLAIVVAVAGHAQHATGGRALVPIGVSVAGVVAIIAMTGSPRLALQAQAEIAGVRNTYLEHYHTAQFVKAFYPHDTVVVNDLGAVTYFTEARILDVFGLGDVEPLLITRATGAYTRHDVNAWTQAYRPTMAVIQLSWAWAAPRVPAEWTKVAEVTVPTHGQHVGFFAVDPGAAALLRANVAYHYGRVRTAAGYAVQFF